MMIGRLGALCLACHLAFLAMFELVADEPQMPASLRLNQIQVIGTHNSYHLAPPVALRRWIALAGRAAGDAFDYSHRPLPEQFSLLGVRQIELDVFADPQGGHYKSPTFYRMLRGDKPAAEAEAVAGPDPNAGGQLETPGLKVLHVQDVDYLSTTPTFAAALTLVRDWSRAHPRHVPILILVELKDETHGLLPTRPVPFDADRIDEVDREIARVFPRDQVFTPDDLRGEEPSLPAALRKRGWPTLESARGKVIFALDNEDRIRDRYLAGREALRGRWMFASVPEDHSAAAWFKVNDAVRDFDRIQRLVKAGFLVRTRADTGSGEARRNDVVRRDRAMASGAQFVSTDYPEPRKDWSAYCVRLPEVPAGVAFRRNPVSE
jgi:Phosphoinositide phospholipase C, Ca2+-dependent